MIKSTTSEYSCGIKGWLIFYAIVLVVVPIQKLSVILRCFNRLPPERTSDPRTWIIGIIEIILIVAFFSVAYLFFRKRRIAIRSIIFLMATFISLELIQFIIKMFQYDQYNLYMFLCLIKTIVIAAIFIPYFLKSKRVKETFVN